MKVQAPHHILLALLGIIALVLTGCGGNEDMAKQMGCPSGSILANSDDVVVADTGEPTGSQFYLGANVGGFVSGVLPSGTLLYSTYFAHPVKFSVWTATNAQRKNNICVVLTTDGAHIWDFIGGTDHGTGFVTKTDDSGSVTVWVSSEPSLSSAASATAGSAGDDFLTNDSVGAYSGGAAQAFWNWGYTVKGCPDSATWPVGYTCP